MTVQLAKKITEFFIKCQVIKGCDRDIYEYCFQVLLMNLLNYGTILLLAIACRCITETVLYVIGFLVIRKQAGGLHLSTPFRCYLASVFSYLVFILLLTVVQASWIKPICLIAIVLSFIIIWHYAPVADKNKPFSIGEYDRYKRNSRLMISLLVGLNFAIYVAKAVNIQVYMLPLDMGVLFAAVSLLSAKLKKQDINQDVAD